MNWKRVAGALTITALLFQSSCYLVMGTPVSGNTGGPTTDPQVLIDQAVASTMVAQTQISLSVQQTMAAMVIDTPSITPSPTFTFTPEIPRVSVSVETNCRSGPGTAYDILGILPVGQSAEVVGRSVYNDNWIIKLPSNPAITCWLWGQYAMVTGNTSGLTVYTPPPTPTPVMNFNIAYNFTISCFGWSFQLKVTNTGSTTWESNSVHILDQNNGNTSDGFSNNFVETDGGCPVSLVLSNLLDLTPGEYGYLETGSVMNNPTGHNVQATVTLCSQNGSGGTCIAKTITFTP